MTQLGLEYGSAEEALAGAIYTLTAISKRDELPAWLKARAADEANACREIVAKANVLKELQGIIEAAAIAPVLVGGCNR